MKLYIKRWGINGEGIAYDKKTPVFVEGAIPGELVEAKIESRTPKYQMAAAEKILEESPRRRHPICSKWQECGGCSLMHVDYKGQMQMKVHVLKEALKKYAGYTGPIQPVLKNPNPLAYRNAIKMPFGKKNGHIITGMYKKNSNSFVPIERCIVHSKALEHVRIGVTELLDKYELPVWDKENKEELLTMVLKEFNDQVHVILVTTPGLELPAQLIEEIMAMEDVASLWQSGKTRMQDNEGELFGETIDHLAGEQEIDLQLDDLALKLLPRSFFQLNTEQAKNLYGQVVALIPENTGTLVEAYCGIGTMSLLAAHKAKEVIGIENIPDAVENAKENEAANHKDNVTFICGDAAEETKLLSAAKKIDTLLVDPPRSGLSPEMLEAILKARPATVIYVSCNPSTLAKDLGTLRSDYEIELVQPVDMFSQTPHIETIVLLKRISSSSKILASFQQDQPGGYPNASLKDREGSGRNPKEQKPAGKFREKATGKKEEKSFSRFHKGRSFTLRSQNTEKSGKSGKPGFVGKAGFPSKATNRSFDQKPEFSSRFGSSSAKTKSKHSSSQNHSK